MVVMPTRRWRRGWRRRLVQLSVSQAPPLPLPLPPQLLCDDSAYIMRAPHGDDNHDDDAEGDGASGMHWPWLDGDSGAGTGDGGTDADAREASGSRQQQQVQVLRAGDHAQSLFEFLDDDTDG